MSVKLQIKSCDKNLVLDKHTKWTNEGIKNKNENNLYRACCLT